MKSPIITFRLSTYHLARGLLAVKRLDHTYQPSSIHQLVKLIYHDYCAKMAIAKSDDIPPYIWSDLQKIMPSAIGKPTVGSDKSIIGKLSILDEMHQINNPTKDVPFHQALKPQAKDKHVKNPLFEDIESDSIKDNVTDFSIPPELLAQMMGEQEDKE